MSAQRVKLSSDEVQKAIARFAAEKAGWGWHRGVVVQGIDFGSGIDAELRDGQEAAVLLTRSNPALTEHDVHYQSCFDSGCERCERIEAERKE